LKCPLRWIVSDEMGAFDLNLLIVFDRACKKRRFTVREAHRVEPARDESCAQSLRYIVKDELFAHSERMVRQPRAEAPRSAARDRASASMQLALEHALDPAASDRRFRGGAQQLRRCRMERRCVAACGGRRARSAARHDAQAASGRSDQADHGDLDMTTVAGSPGEALRPRLAARGSLSHGERGGVTQRAV